MTNIDLHIHTNCSDGELKPIEIIDEAIKKCIKYISITDHDSIEAYTNELFDYAKKNDIELITGVEISTRFNNIGFHVLGYNFDIHNKELNNKLKLLKNARHNYLIRVCDKLKKLGYDVHYQDLNKIDLVTKAHIARDIIQNKENESLLFKVFSHIPTVGEFIESIMNEGCLAFVEKETITPKEASWLIKNAGGKVVLAHPVCYKYENDCNDNEIIEIIKNMNADGLEAYYIYIDRNDNKINEIKKWKQFAFENQLFVTTGSDFHNFDSIHPIIGLLNENIELSSNEKKEIIKAIKK